MKQRPFNALENLQFDQLQVLEELPGKSGEWVFGQISVKKRDGGKKRIRNSILKQAFIKRLLI